MVTRSAPRETSETWHMRLRLDSHARIMTINNVTCARVNNGKRADGMVERQKERENSLYRSRFS